MKFCESYFGRKVQAEGVVSAGFSTNIGWQLSNDRASWWKKIL